MKTTTKETQATKQSLIVGLIAGRHELPVEGYIFEQDITNVFDFEYIQKTVCKKLGGFSNVTVYVTGLTLVTVEVIKFCVSRDINLTLMHFNRELGTYVPQVANYVEYCDYCKSPIGVNGWFCKNCGSH